VSARPAVLYVVSRFPAVTETFVVNEWLALSGRFRMELAALRRSGEAPLHSESRAALDRVRFLGPPGPAAPAAHLRWLVRRPRAYLSVLWAMLRGARGLPARQAARHALVLVEAPTLARHAQRAGVAHVHAHFANHPATAAWIVHRLTGLPFSFTAHANDLFTGPALLERKAVDARFVVAISDFNRRRLLELDPAPRVELVHCGVDLDHHRWRGPDDRDRDVVLCVASLAAKKGHVHLIEALALLAERRPAIALELAGDGPERERILRRARELGVADRVRLLGALPAEAVRARLARAGAFALASVALPSGRMEGIPVALMEAMAAGAPVVATDLSGIPELVRPGETGLLVAAGDAPALAAALASLLEDGELAAGLARRARALVERSFSLADEAGRLGDLFAESVSGRS
jgi:glycosyltransferase involved in cell wall biosynthesis